MGIVPSMPQAGQQSTSGARRRSDSGQSLIEFALVALAMVAMLLGVIDVGRFAYIGILVGNAARAGAAYGATNPEDDPGIENAACNDFLGDITTPTNLFPKPTCDGSSGSTNHLEVTFPSSQTDFLSCGCDGSGAYTATYYGSSACAVTQAYIATNCGASGDHWASEVTVEATGTFKALFLPTSVTFNQTATERVP